MTTSGICVPLHAKETGGMGVVVAEARYGVPARARAARATKAKFADAGFHGGSPLVAALMTAFTDECAVGGKKGQRRLGFFLRSFGGVEGAGFGPGLGIWIEAAWPRGRGTLIATLGRKQQDEPAGNHRGAAVWGGSRSAARGAGGVSGRGVHGESCAAADGGGSAGRE